MNAKRQISQVTELSVEDALRASRPETSMPAGLHDAIMDQVRAAGPKSPHPHASRAWLFLLRWLSAPAFAAVALGAFLLLHSPPNRHDPLAVSPLAMGPALTLGDEATRTLPPAVIAPLSEELQRVNLDLENTAQHLLASLP